MFFALTSSTWEGLSDGVAILIIAALLIMGLFLGYALRGLVGRWQAEAIEKRMRLREEETESEIKARLKEADIAARAAVVKARETFEASTKKRREELQSVEDRQTQREANLDRKATALDERAAAVDAKAEAAETAGREAAEKIKGFVDAGFGELPICVAKTQYSLSDNAKALGRPEDFTLTVRDVWLSAGAGYLVVLTGAIVTMPGLPPHPAALDIDIDPDGTIHGLF